jgi:hypothetical protein
MTHFWKDSERQDVEGTSVWLWGKYVAPVVYDLAETMMMLWEQTCVPAFKAFGYMTYMLVKTCLLSRFEGIGTATAEYHREQKLTALASKDLRNTHRLSSQSEMHLRKIQGAIGDNWSAATHPPLHAQRGKAERWENSRRKHSTHVASNPWQNALVSNRAQSSNAPAEHEDIMGLDDIFNRPVSGLFMDEPLQPGQTERTIRRNASPVTAQSQATQDIKGQPAAKKEMARPVATPVPVALGRAENNQSVIGGRPVYAQGTLSDGGWAEEGRNDDAFGSVADDDALPEPTQWVDAADEMIEPLVPPTETEPAKPLPPNYSDDVPPGLLVADQTEYPVNATPWFAEECENPLAALNNAPASDVPWLTPPEQSSKPASKQPALPKPVIRPVEKKAPPPPLPKPLPPARPPEPLRLDHELEEDLNGFDYMVQNNRILSNSISNLVDSYFLKASLEEDANLY